MKRLALAIAISVASWGALACGYKADLCELMRQVERGEASSALPKLATRANGGEIQAQLALGAIYATGAGISQDDKVALDWFKKAATAGDREAQSIVGNFYAAGRGVAIDLPESRRWHQLAADRGNPDSQRMLGLIYARGEGAPLDYRSAYFWFALSAIGGDLDAAKYRDMVVPYLSQADLEAAKIDVAKWRPVQTQ